MGQTEEIIKQKTAELKKAREDREATIKEAEEKKEAFRNAKYKDHKENGDNTSPETRAAFEEYKSARNREAESSEKVKRLENEQAAAIAYKKSEDNGQPQREMEMYRARANSRD
jgi:hypothetical protein